MLKYPSGFEEASSSLILKAMETVRAVLADQGQGDFAGNILSKLIAAELKESGFMERARRTRNRALCITKKERVCNVSGRAKLSDVIAVLAGGLTPYVLRSVGDMYQYIGTAYVPGTENGSLYEEKNPEDIDYEIRII